jgi:putative methionine-R-sulfoxide reductase with GAF domain
MSIALYLEQSGLLATLTAVNTDIEDFSAAVSGIQQQLLAHVSQSKPTVQWQYQIPELGEGGACSLFGHLAAEPYDLAATLGGETADNLALLQRMTAVVEFYQQHSRSDWFGIYQRLQNLAGESVLVKLAYFGAPSRPEFPLTAEFATISNNSSVALSGQARLISQVASYVAAGGEYYTCDPKVQAEACLPLYTESGQVLGIVDAEAFSPDLYAGGELALLVAVVTVLPLLFTTIN